MNSQAKLPALETIGALLLELNHSELYAVRRKCIDLELEMERIEKTRLDSFRK